MPDAEHAADEGAAGRPGGRVRRAVRWLLVAAVLSALAWVGYNETFLARSRSTGEELTVRAQPGVPEQDVAVAVEAVRTADRFLADVLRADRAEHVDLKLATFSPCMPYVPLSRTGSAVADEDEMCVNTRRGAWPHARSDPQAATVLLAHERFHNVQGQLGCLPGPDEHEYAWVEGSATWVGFAAAVHAGLLTERAADEELDRWRAAEPDAGPLPRYERGISGDGQYALAARAVEVLVRRTEPNSLLTFCRSVGDGRPWRDAFRSAFGLPVDAFYREIERPGG